MKLALHIFLRFANAKMLFFTPLLLSIPTLTLCQYSKDRYHHKDIIAANKVSSYQIYSVKTSENGIDSTLEEELFFDTRGNLIKEITYDYLSWTVYRYDKNDRIIAEEKWAPGIQFYERDTFIYKKSLLIRRETYDSLGQLQMHWNYMYNNSLLIEQQWTIVGYGAPNITTYEYDSLGRMTAEILPSHKRRTEFEYDTLGNLVTFKSKDAISNVHDTFRYNGKLRTEELITGRSTRYIRRFEYDAAGLIRYTMSCPEFPTKLEDCHVIEIFVYHYYQ